MNLFVKNFYKSLVVIDYETTGLDPYDVEVIETGTSSFDGNTWSMEGELFNVAGALPVKTQSVCLITPRMLEGREEFIYKRNEFFDSIRDRFIVAHNAKYEFLVSDAYGANIPEEQFICTLRLGRKLFPELESYNLPDMRYHFDLSEDRPELDNLQLHRAPHDAYFTARLLEVMVETMLVRGIIEPGPDMLADVVQYAQEPTIYQTVPFGKHKGKPFSEVPADYWLWCIENMDSLNPENKLAFDPDLLATIDKVLPQ
tara:strand:+ start:75295 stop:76065 length:771 start_codon:yes stop_codon:yes gene_type:complete